MLSRLLSKKDFYLRLGLSHDNKLKFCKLILANFQAGENNLPCHNLCQIQLLSTYLALLKRPFC